MSNRIFYHIVFFVLFVFFCFTSSTADASIPGSISQWTNWNTASVWTGPPAEDTVFSIDRPVIVTYLDSYHWNDGKGVKDPGTISLGDENGEIYGPFQMYGNPGQGGVPNAWWTLSLENEELVLQPGTYRVIDSQPESWSNNAESGNAGFFAIKWTEFIDTPPTVSPSPDITLTPVVNDCPESAEIQQGINHDGNDYGTPTSADSICDCMELCQDDDQCKAVTYWKGKCYLKNNINPIPFDSESWVKSGKTEISTGEVDVSFLADYAYILNIQSKYDKSLEVCNQAQKFNSNNAVIFSMKGWALLGQGKYDEALVNLNKALETYPDDPLTLTNAGYCLASQGRCQEAKTIIDHLASQARSTFGGKTYQGILTLCSTSS